MLDSLSGPGEPLIRALMGCGIDRPSVTVSRWIKESERETQRREEARKERERRRDQTWFSSKRSFLFFFLRDSSLSYKKRT